MALLRSVVLLVALSCTTTLAFHKKPFGFHSRNSRISADVLWSGTETVVRYAGYECESHTVLTPDGYELILHRIPRAKNETTNRAAPPHRTPVLIEHGLGANSEMWTLPGPSLAYYLVDAGFDVWLGNFRGSFYGRKHVKLNTKSRAFWDFSWHENAVIDFPASIDYILRITGRPRLFTAGHSMGASTQVIMMAEKPEYAKEKIIAGILLAPPTFFPNNTGSLRILNAIFQAIPTLKNSFPKMVMNDKMPMADISLIPICFNGHRIRAVCQRILDLVMGSPRKPYLDGELVELLLAHYPAGGSIRQFMHFLQSVKQGDFRKYDYGTKRNLRLYGSPEPPSYNIGAIQTPLYLFYGTADHLVMPSNTQVFIKKCPAIKKTFKLQGYNHLDFVVGDTADIIKSVNQPVLKILESYL